MAADVVKSHQDEDEEDAINSSMPLVFTEEQQKYVHELDRKAASLSRSIQELRLRLPPPDISQRLPHLHAHSVDYDAALTQQINSSHSSTREQIYMHYLKLSQGNYKWVNLLNILAHKQIQTYEFYQIRLQRICSPWYEGRNRSKKFKVASDIVLSDDCLFLYGDICVNVWRS